MALTGDAQKNTRQQQVRMAVDYRLQFKRALLQARSHIYTPTCTQLSYRYFPLAFSSVHVSLAIYGTNN
jgi:hypothetical protein